jgi:hypothetical protein
MILKIFNLLIKKFLLKLELDYRLIYMIHGSIAISIINLNDKYNFKDGALIEDSVGIIIKFMRNTNYS